jgi:hypothetical protein
MKRLLITIIFALPHLALAQPGLQASANAASPTLRRACVDRLEPSSLVFEVQSAQPVIGQKLGLGELRKMMSVSPQDAVFGITEFTPEVQVEWTARAVTENATDLNCARISATIRVGITPQSVHIAREIPPGSCPYQVVLEHEMGHVRINNSHMEQVAGMMNEQARAEFASRAWFGSPEEIKSAIREELTRVWIARMEVLLESAGNLHAQHDIADRELDGLAACLDKKPALTAKRD